MKKRLVCLVIAVVAMAATDASARIFIGHLGGGDGTWAGAGNWSDDGATVAPTPDAGTAVQAINVPGYGVTVAAPGAQAATVDVGTWGWVGSMDVTAAGTLTTAGNLTIAAQDAASVGTAVNAGLINVGGVAYLHAGVGTLENSGTFNSTDLVLGHLAGSDTTLINTGDITTGVMYLTVGGNSVFNMNGGTVNAASFVLTSPGVGHLQLDGGTITVAALSIDGNANNTIDITEGILIAAGDHSGGLDWMAGNGEGGMSTPVITAYGGVGTVVAEYNPGLNQTTLYAIPEPATLSLVALLGGGMLWARKRFNI